jgi:ribosomal-protein-alanine N-acetyltransferase
VTPDALARLHATAFATPRPWTASEFATLLASPHVFLTVQPHAFALGRVIADEAELLTIATDPTKRRQGLGRNTLTGFEVEAKARGAASAFLEVAANNTAALALYLGNDWTISGTRPAYYATPDGTRIDAQILSKHLT